MHWSTEGHTELLLHEEICLRNKTLRKHCAQCFAVYKETSELETFRGWANSGSRRVGLDGEFLA